MLANKRNRVLGKFLISMDATNFEDLKISVLVSRTNKLDIADAQLYLISSDQLLSGLHSGPEDFRKVHAANNQ